MSILIKHDWTLEELKTLHTLPFFQLLAKAHQVHQQFHQVGEIQVCHLISVKTGGCSEDCKYCAQSSRYQTSVSPQALMSYEQVLNQAQEALKQGVTRIGLGAAWREVKNNKPFDEILKMIKGIADLGIEVCCTLGMLTTEQAQRLKEAGLYAYNHNLDSSEKFYPSIITTRTYQDRLNTLDVVQKTGLSVCCGGILGMGEEIEDRFELLLTLSRRMPHPDSVPINQLSPIPGTPLENQTKISVWDFIRIVAVTRIVLPQAIIRLSAGRVEMSYSEQALCFMGGANSIFSGEKLLTVGNSSIDQDQEMFELLNLKKRPAFAERNIL